MKIGSVDVDHTHPPVFDREHLFLETKIVGTSVRDGIAVFISCKSYLFTVTGKKEVAQDKIAFFLVEQGVLPGLCIVEAQLLSGKIGDQLSVLCLCDLCLHDPCRIVGQLFHFPALKIHTKKLTALRFRIAAVRLKVDVLAGGIEGVVREIQMKIQVLICQLRDGLSAHGIEKSVFLRRPFCSDHSLLLLK